MDEHPYMCEGWDWLDGPAFCEWIEPYIPPSHERASRHLNPWVESLRRRMWDWRQGRRVTIWAVDPYLVSLGLHPLDIPSSIWRIKGPGSRRPYPRHVREAVLTARDEGAGYREVEKRFGPQRLTVKKWERAA
jgi:hypothetical protein